MPVPSGHVDGGAADDGKVRDQPAGVVLRQDADMGARGQADGNQPGSQLLHGGVQFRERDRPQPAIRARVLQSRQGRIFDDRFLKQPDKGRSHFSLPLVVG